MPSNVQPRLKIIPASFRATSHDLHHIYSSNNAIEASSIMDRDIFEQLDQLGARSLARPLPNPVSTRRGWTAVNQRYSNSPYNDENLDDILDEPTVFDAFDQHLLRDLDTHRNDKPVHLSMPANDASTPSYEPHRYQRVPPEYQTPHAYERPAHLAHVNTFGGYEHECHAIPDRIGDECRNLELHGSQRPPSQAEDQAANSSSGLPVVQGITLISTRQLPDRCRGIFPFPLFNAIQSKCFQCVYETNHNFVVSAPTGSGKTAIFEIAICRLLMNSMNGDFKVVYQAPTKSLCSERFRDWQSKFAPLDLRVAELTGDTDSSQLHNVQSASIIVTTPEKWDSITHEVHILKEDRGATLEAVVSRMKSVGTSVRFIALSATVPNSQDIAKWLGKDTSDPSSPAPRERFGEEFRPVRLQRHVCGYASNGNDFSFDTLLNNKLLEVIPKWSKKKPTMIFCFTRRSCTVTAKVLANWWATRSERERCWPAPTQRIIVEEKELQDSIVSGVAFHHAGLSPSDRSAIEGGFLKGDVHVICCTSTLAVGVNLPCHMVIIKNTVTYQNKSTAGIKEYSDLEIMQMLGRAGRPQFDNSAVAVIMTRLQRVPHYENMIAGHEVLESRLHENLIDHLNAEIGLGTITNISSARNWLTSTFLYVRLKENPEHYKITDRSLNQSLDERLETICNKGIKQLQDSELVQKSETLRCTEFGDAMSRYCVQFGTMKTLLTLQVNARVSEILSAIAQAAEFQEIRFRAGEKPAYREINKNPSIKFPIPSRLDSGAHKVSLIIQAVLGAVDPSFNDSSHRIEYAKCKSMIFQHVQRFIRCVIDCQLHLQDSISARNALALGRSLGAEVWDDSPLHMKQLDGLGLISVRKLVAADIKSIEELEGTESYQIERALARNPPFGIELQTKAKAFPRPHLCLSKVGNPLPNNDKGVTVKVKADLCFQNHRISATFNSKPIYVCLLVDTTEGNLVHFARISAKKLSKGLDLQLSVRITSTMQSVRGFIMCDGIAGTQQAVTLLLDIPRHMFPPLPDDEVPSIKEGTSNSTASTTRPSAITEPFATKTNLQNNEDEFMHIDELDLCDSDEGVASRPKISKDQSHEASHEGPRAQYQLQKLPNGKWACNHHCKDKTACKHVCCREGLSKEPKAKSKSSKNAVQNNDFRQTQLTISVSKANVAPFSRKFRQEGVVKNKGTLGEPHKHEPSTAVREGADSVSSVRRQTDVLINGSRPRQTRSSSSDYGLDESQDDIMAKLGNVVEERSFLQNSSANQTTEPPVDAEELLSITSPIGTKAQHRNVAGTYNEEDLRELSYAFDQDSDDHDPLCSNNLSSESFSKPDSLKTSSGRDRSPDLFISSHRPTTAGEPTSELPSQRENPTASIHEQPGSDIRPTKKTKLTSMPTKDSSHPEPDLSASFPELLLPHHSMETPPIAHPGPIQRPRPAPAQTNAEDLSKWFTSQFGSDMFHLNF